MPAFSRVSGAFTLMHNGVALAYEIVSDNSNEARH